ncbi:MAG: hypothetical protein P1U89_21660 [Verrucomicrobiales bacterium]|nr:hypothetical protein [Verrucomicrobiales bacterium]
MNRWISVLMFAWVSLVSLCGEDAYRTDANNNETLSWFQLKGNNYPPAGTSHHIAGELIKIDHTERSFVLRTDRTDNHSRSHFDLPLFATMLPYGSIYYHGAPAALEDIPHGTHLHGHFYIKDPEDKTPPAEGWHGRITPEADFNRCFRLEDDFSYYRSAGKLWKIEAVDLEEMTLTVVLVEDGKPGEDPQIFDLLSSARVWQGRSVVDLESLKKGQEILFNYTWATLYGPGRIREIWLDEESREFAAKAQKEKHLIYQKQRGLAGRVDAVDNKNRLVTIDIFGGVSPELLDDLQKDLEVGVAVARESLVTYDPVNDRKRGPIVEIKKVDPAPGSSGVQITVNPNLLLEGYRPGKIVRVYPANWPVIALPMEERYFGRY